MTQPYPWEAVLEAASLDIAERAEALVVAEKGPLTRTTSETEWFAYWTAVADKVRELSR